jgi:hypothetical protein
MPRTKISEFSATAASNTDIDSINIAEGCAPSGINDAIRELMAQLKDFQTGAVGDSFNGPVGSTTAAAGAFTTLSASSTVSGTGFSTYLASPPAIGGTAAAAGSFTTLAASGAVTLSGGTANGVPYLNGSKVVTSGSALTFDGTLNILSVSGGINSIIGATNPLAGAFTSITASSTLSVIGNITNTAGTANGVAYLNGSKVVTSGSALVFDGTNLGVGTTNPAAYGKLAVNGSTNVLNGNFLYMYDSGNTNAPGMYAPGDAFAWKNSAGSTEWMRINSTGLGIGTSSPATKLDVYGVVRASTGSSLYTSITSPATGGVSGKIISADNNLELTADSLSSGTTNLIFKTSASGTTSEKMRIDSSGNLGLGVTPSAWTATNIKALQVSNGGFANNGGSGFITNNAFYTGGGAYTPTYISSSASQMISFNRAGGNDIQFLTAASGTAGNAITFTQAMTLDASGNLAIGATSANQRLEVVSSVSPFARFRSTASSFTGVDIGQNSAGAGVIDVRDNQPLILYTNDTERARIDTSGNFLVGATSSAYTNADCAFLLPTVGGGQAVIQHKNTSSSGSSFVDMIYNAGRIGNITQNGTTGVLYNLTSDYRLKNNPQALTGAKEFVMALQPKKWQWWDGSGEGVGFIAHEFMEVAKHSGNGEKDAVDSKGNPIMQSIQPSSSEVMANLVSLVQEQQALIVSLQARLDAANL